MFSCVILCVSLIALYFTFEFLTDKEERFALSIERHLWKKVGMYVFVLGLFWIVLWYAGAVARGEQSPIPWIAFNQGGDSRDSLDRYFAMNACILFLLWAYIVPGHLYANAKKKKEGVRPRYPYAINILVGLLLSTEHNLVYRFLVMLAPLMRHSE
jgi:hypothetical protein